MAQISILFRKLTNFNRNEIIIAIIGILLIIAGFLIGIEDNPPGISLVLIGFFIFFYIILSHFSKYKNLNPIQKFIYWAPRTLCIIITLFFSVFALDVFEEHKGFLMICIALFMHLIPTFIMIAILVFSWRREWIGSILFNLLGVLYIILFWGRFPLATYCLISGPLFFTGILFLISWKNRSKLSQDSNQIS